MIYLRAYLALGIISLTFNALRAMEPENSPNPVITIKAISEQVKSLLDKNKNLDAQFFLEEILEDYKNPERENIDYIKLLSELAHVYMSLGKLKESLDLHSTCLKIANKIIPSDPDLAKFLYNQAFILHHLGKHKKAFGYCEQAMSIAKNGLGERDPLTLKIIALQANIQLSKGNYEKSKSILDSVLASQLEVLGKKHLDYIRSQIDWLRACQATGNFSLAKEFIEENIELWSQILADNYLLKDLCVEQANLYIALGEPKKALNYLKQAEELHYKFFDKSDHPDLAPIFDAFSLAHYSEGKYQEALKFSERALTIRAKFFGTNHPLTMVTQHNMALILQNQGYYYFDAKLRLNEVFNHQEKTMGENHPDFVRTIHSLANLYKIIGKYEESKGFYERAKKVGSIVFKEHPFLAVIINDQGSLCKALGQINEAFLLYEKAYEINARLLGEEHPDTLRILNNIASIYLSTGNFQYALDLLLNILKIKQKTPEEIPLATAEIYNNIGIAYQALGKSKKAISYFKMQFNIIKKMLGKDHPKMIMCLQNIALVYKTKKQYRMAEKYSLKALRISQASLGIEHMTTATSENQYAEVFFLQGKFDESFKYAQSSLAKRNKIFGQKTENFGIPHPKTGLSETLGLHADVATSCHTLGFFYHSLADNTNNVTDKAKHFAQAEYYYLLALKLRRFVLNAAHPDISMTTYNLAAVYQAQGKISDALILYQDDLKSKKKIFGEYHLNTSISCGNIGALYFSKSDFALALEFFTRALAIRNAELSENHEQILLVLVQMGLCNLRLQRYADSFNLFQEVVLRNKKAKIASQSLGMALNGLSALIQQLEARDMLPGRFNINVNIIEQALLLFEDTYKEVNKTPERNQGLVEFVEDNIVFCCERLGKFYLSLDQMDKALRLFEKLSLYKGTDWNWDLYFNSFKEHALN